MSKHVAIIGGSFAGMNVAIALDKVPGITVTVIEKRPFFHYTIGSVRGAVDAAFAESIVVDYSNAVTKNTKYVSGTVVQISDKSLTLDNGSTINFDYVVIASGVKYAAPYRFTATTKAAYLAENADFRTKLTAANQVVLIGGGPANIELAAEIKTAFPKKSVTVIDRSQYLAGAGTNGFSTKLHDNILKPLTNLGVKVLLGEAVDLAPFQRSDGTFESVVVGQRTIRVGSKTVDADLVIVAPGGYKPNTEFVVNSGLGDILDARGFVKVQATLQVPGHSNFYALGDAAAANAPKTNVMAISQAGIVSANVTKAITGEGKEKTWDGEKAARMMVVALGPTAGTGVMGNFSFPGFLAKMFKSKDLMWGMTKGNLFRKQ